MVGSEAGDIGRGLRLQAAILLMYSPLSLVSSRFAGITSSMDPGLGTLGEGENMGLGIWTSSSLPLALGGSLSDGWESP